MSEPGSIKYMAPMVKQKPCQDYLFTETIRKPSSLMGDSSNSPGPRADGIKDYAWNGVPADNDGRLIHHYNKDFNLAFERR